MKERATSPQVVGEDGSGGACRCRGTSVVNWKVSREPLTLALLRLHLLFLTLVPLGDQLA